MPANSKHYGDVHLWIVNMIENCNSLNHVNTIHNLIDNFQELYWKEQSEWFTICVIPNLKFKLNCRTDNLRTLHGI